MYYKYLIDNINRIFTKYNFSVIIIFIDRKNINKGIIFLIRFYQKNNFLEVAKYVYGII
jgi:hypothetical protein